MTCLCLAKIAHLLFFHRLMEGMTLRYALYAATAFIISGSITIICCFIFACNPIWKSWDVLTVGHCMNRPAIFVAIAVLNIVWDLLLILLPFSLVWKLNLSSQQKTSYSLTLLVVSM